MALLPDREDFSTLRPDLKKFFPIGKDFALATRTKEELPDREVLNASETETRG
jgi:hypothetical protein